MVDEAVQVDLRAARKEFASAQQSTFAFGPLEVRTTFEPRERLVDGQHLTATFRAADEREIQAGMAAFNVLAGGFGLIRGIEGTLDNRPFEISRNGPRIRRRSRVVRVTGAVELAATSSWFARARIFQPNVSGRVVCTSDGKVALVDASASMEEMAMICLLLINGVPDSTSLLRWIQGL